VVFCVLWVWGVLVLVELGVRDAVVQRWAEIRRVLVPRHYVCSNSASQLTEVKTAMNA